ncbi:alpha/beta-hydrolase [Neolentinus lepideus HHB14362 ss-1]|uniref:Carboxylic ester hydrolase n=1 Tax=Neolentinus lepideus HHB14362 ss-1 TaxID=1314782 RepID=A0A165QEH8_9AGAM|nr:alpha/beta-hydrolase [Neolentinus lepideus HHB14362 ss-1]
MWLPYNTPFFLALGSSVLAPDTVLDPVVDLGYVSYRGNQSNVNTVAFLGIAYAEPPTGELRWRAPVELNTTRITEISEGHVVDATAYPEPCIQGTTGSGDPGGAGSEDCLKVNVYAPSNATAGSNLPVLVYIHGGGYTYGTTASFPFDHWVEQSPNVVVVAPYYRLDSFGFLSHPDFADGSLGDFNVGFQDQIQALKWIKNHIHAFGGDPSKVTINGHSAGGGSVELHLVANEGEKLFSAAIAQSVYRSPMASPEQSIPLFQYYADHAGCACGSTEDQMKCLRNTNVSDLARAQDAAYYDLSGYHFFLPVLDGDIFKDYPTKSIIRGEFARVPLIVGATSNETVFISSDVAESLSQVYPSLNDFDLEGVRQVYSPTQYDSEAQRIRDAMGESVVRCAREVLGSAFSVLSNTWTYRYNQPNPTVPSKAVEHSAENWMMFRGVHIGFNGTSEFTTQTPAELAFASELIAYWLSFVRSGNPNTYKLDSSPHWSQYSVTNRTRIVLQQGSENLLSTTGSYMEFEPAEESLRCAFVASKAEHEQN